MIELSNSAKASMRRRIQVHRKNGGRCFYCGIHVRCADEELPRDWLRVRGGGVTMIPEHAQPLSRGGSDSLDNLLPSCAACNAAKGPLTLDEFRLVRGLRSENPSATFPGEEPGRRRDWLCVFSSERAIFAHNMPWARDAYSRGKPLRQRRKEAARLTKRGASPA